MKILTAEEAFQKCVQLNEVDKTLMYVNDQIHEAIKDYKRQLMLR